MPTGWGNSGREHCVCVCRYVCVCVCACECVCACAYMCVYVMKVQYKLLLRRTYLLLLSLQVPEEHAPGNGGLPHLPRPAQHLHLGGLVLGGDGTMRGEGGGGEAKGQFVGGGLLRSARAGHR